MFYYTMRVLGMRAAMVEGYAESMDDTEFQERLEKVKKVAMEKGNLIDIRMMADAPRTKRKARQERVGRGFSRAPHALAERKF